MSCEELIAEIGDSTAYTLHTHTQFCDGRAQMEDFVKSAVEAGFTHLGFTPHSPVPIESPCNMDIERVGEYFSIFENLKEEYKDRITLLKGMEIDFLSDKWGAHTDYFKQLGLDYSISSIHFIPSVKGELIDIDGSFESFSRKMPLYFDNDIEYVVRTFADQTHLMLDRGGFQIIGHFDKVAMNSSRHCPGIDSTPWFRNLFHEIIEHIASTGHIVEINTKAYNKSGRFFPDTFYWKYILEKKIPVVVNSDAHQPDLIDVGRREALTTLGNLEKQDFRG